MGKVLMKIKVMPEDTDVNLEEIVERVKNIKIKDVEIRDWGIKPIAFGLKALIILAILPDRAEIGDVLVEEIQKVEGVGSVEVEDVELL
ncbi:MAG: elongation factor 1-beta [Archaeoglobaceae archaeon]|nr:elongation factor 1-beta [Archaeoglobaceae archaeon]MCX8151862.1 elongation factor 1-beta [Archaeoglobaceae archaeon]MDW8014306.1 elongation factor 1-beta [Archaeoglobaceae archaeon]